MHDKITADLRFSIVPAWLLDSGLSDKAVRLYAVLAGYADAETGQAYPGRKLLSKRLACSMKTIDRAVSELIEAGAVKKQQRIKDGHYQSSLYTVVRIDPVSGKTPPSDTDDPTSRHPRPDLASPVSHRTITTELEPVEPKPLNNIDSHFDTFWAEYPRKQGKGKAREAFRTAVKNAGVDAVIAGAVRYASDPNLPDPQFIPLPTTWLNQERWDDGPLPLNRKMTNSEHNIQNFRASLALLAEQPMKEVENEQVRNKGAIDFGVNFRSADSV
jgi:hypothetical protein